MNNVELQVFESLLYKSYCDVKEERHTLYVSLHAVMAKMGLPISLFNVRLVELWHNQFSQNTKYVISLESDATPLEYYRLRGKPIIIDGVKRFIIQMSPNKDGKNG